jgi:proteasome lid subunit RPN8/RPN11
MRLTVKQKDEIIQHAKDSRPHEACGILAGKSGRVEKVYKMKNTSDRPEICYFMEPKEQLTVMKEMRNSGMEMIGIYHSHTGSDAYPSARDLELAFYPESAYLIVSLKNIDAPELRAFRIVAGNIEEEKIEGGN